MIEKLLDITHSWQNIASEASTANVLHILLENDDLSDEQILNLLRDYIKNYWSSVYKPNNYKIK